MWNIQLLVDDITATEILRVLTANNYEKKNFKCTVECVPGSGGGTRDIRPATEADIRPFGCAD